MDTRLIAMLLGEAKLMRADLDKIDTEKRSLGSGITAFVPLFNNLFARAKQALTEDPIAQHSLSTVGEAEQISEMRPVQYHKAKKFELITGLGAMIAVLELLLPGASTVAPMRVTREGVFFAGEYFEPLRFAADLIAKASKIIAVIDNYLGDGQVVLNLLTAKATEVLVRMLTKEDDLKPPMLVLAEAFRKQHGGLELRTSRAFHDRFIILDDQEFYHFGASLKDMGSRGFMFSRIEEPEVIDKIRAKFAEEWTKATVKI